MKLESQVVSLELAKQLKRFMCFIGMHSWVYSLREAQELNPDHKILLSGDSNVHPSLWFCSNCEKRMFPNGIK